MTMTVCLAVCLSVCLSPVARYGRLVRKLYPTNQRENLGLCWEYETRLPDRVLWHNRKSKMADGR